MTKLKSVWDPLIIRNVKFVNRIGASPMCMYSSTFGYQDTNFHLIHTASRVNGLGLFIVEASGVTEEGRITPNCLGIYSDDHIQHHKRIIDYVHDISNCKIGIQLAHSGLKGSTSPPHTYQSIGCNNPIQPLSVEEYGDSLAWQAKHVNNLTINEIDTLINDSFPKAVDRSIGSGYDFIELHFAHGYLLHGFYSPILNKRTDKYGGSFENRIRLPIEIAKKVRCLYDGPLFIRLSCDDYIENGWNINDCVLLANELYNIGVDLIDCSSGGINIESSTIMRNKWMNEELCQLKYSESIKNNNNNILTATVGGITKYDQAKMIIENNKADIVLIGKQLLKEPYLAINWQKQEGIYTDYPVQYGYVTDHKYHRSSYNLSK